MRRYALLSFVLSMIICLATHDAGAVTLDEAYTAALSTHESVQIAGEGVVQADSRVDQAWTYLYPRISAQGSYTLFDDVLPPDGTFVFQPLRQLQASLVLVQPLYTGGRTLAALRTAKIMQDASRSDLALVRQNLMLGVAEAYYGALKARKVVGVSREAVERMERHRQVTEREASTRRTKANASTLLRANALVDQAKIALTIAESNLSVARKRLNLLTQIPEEEELSEPPVLSMPSESLVTLQERAFSARDDYQGAQQSQKAAKEMVTITRGAHYPQIYAEGGARYQDSSPETMMDATTYYGGIRIQVPIFEGGLMRSEVAEARSKQRQAELNTLLLQRTIKNDVAEAYLNCQTVTTVLRTAETQFDSARKNFDAVEGLFAEGLVPSISVIDAQQALSGAEREVVSAGYDQQLSLLRLEKSMGLLGKQISDGAR